MSIEFVVEYCGIEIEKLNLLIIYLYWTERETDMFLDSINKLLVKLKREQNKKIILGGDFNIDMLTHAKFSSDFKNLLLTYNFTQQVKTPTRVCKTTATCIDLIFTNFRKCYVEVQELGLSDHRGVRVQTETESTTKLNTVPKARSRTFTHSQIQHFKFKMKNIDWNQLLNKTKNINENYNIFHNVLESIINESFPEQQAKIKNKNPKLNWLTTGLKLSCKHKRALRSILNHTNNSIIKKYYKSYRKILKKSINISKKILYIKQMYKSDNKTKTMWNIIKAKTGKITTNKHSNIKLKINNVCTESPLEVANGFNKFFASIGESDSCSGQGSFDHDIAYRNMHSIYISPVDNSEVRSLLMKLKNKRSSGFDQLPSLVLKKCVDEFVDPLAILINQSFAEGTFPDLLKNSIIKPIHKGGDKTNPSNYRPIALLPTISKIFERAMSNRLYSFFEKYNVLDSNQYGFRKDRSTTLAVYKFIQQALAYINEKKYAVGILLDMTKAYDRVRFDILLSKLHNAGVRGIAYNWLSSYLKDRLQYVQVNYHDPTINEINSYLSEPKTINGSIPQGSVLGCLLFLIYINDLPKAIDTKCVLFADDVSLLFKFENSDAFRNSIKDTFARVIDWLNEHNLMVNYSKTKLIEFIPYQKSSLDVQLKLNNVTIKKVNTCTLLGLDIDSNLNWKNHIEKIKSKLSRFAYALYELKLSTDQKTAISAYYAYANSWLTYGLILWGNSTNANELFIIQKKLIRILVNITRTDTCRPHFIKLKILTLTSMYILELCKFIHKNPVIFENAKECRLYAPRTNQENRLALPKIRIQMYKESPYVSAIRIFNKLPNALRKEKNTKTFVLKVKDMLIKKCYYNLEEYFNDTFDS